jgi:hypothetical protein
MVERRDAEGLYVAVKDLSHPREASELFGRDLVRHGYVPVAVCLELDQRVNAVFDVRREDIQLCLRDGQRLSTAHPTSVVQEVRYSQARSIAGFFPLILPGFLIASSVRSANMSLESDYTRKALESVRMNPNHRSSQAVVFFKIPRDRRGSFTMAEAFVEMKAYLAGGEGVVGTVLEFPVHFGG